jgi:ATP-binding cassette subfamily B protein
MLRIVKYLKPFTLLIGLAIILLYGQAMADLALPDYMSKIVNVGIQYGGVETDYPEVISEADYLAFAPYASEHGVDIKRFYALKEKNEINDMTFSEDAMNTSYYVWQGEAEKSSDISGLFTDFVLEAYKETGALATIDVNELTRSQIAPKVIQMYYDQIGVDIKALQQSYLVNIGGIMLLVAVIGAIASILVSLLAARIASGFGRNLRNLTFEKVSTFSNVEFDKFSTASLITRNTNDIMQIQNLMVMMVRMLFYAPIMGFGGVVKALDKSQSMSWIIALAVIVLLGIIIIVFSIAMPKFKAVQKLVDKLNGVMRENLSGLMVVRSFNTQAYEKKRFDKANQDLTDTNLFVSRLMVALMPAMMLIMNGVTLLIIWVGAQQIAASQMQVGDMMAFMQYALQIIFSFLMVSMIFIMMPRASVSAGRIADVLETDPMIKNAEMTEHITNPKGNITFDKVSFKFPGASEEMLKDISFTARVGKTTAIIGSTGSGKSTLINLIPRFYDVTKGDILIDHVSISKLPLDELRRLIGYVPQKALLFSGSIESNLRYADEGASDARIEDVIDISQSREIVSEKDKGLASEIAQGGNNVSGGQKQRLSIARALLKKPPIYIFDDSFSALDFKTDRKLRESLADEASDHTIIIVAQRISTIKNADQILVLDEGRIVGKGTHGELMASCQTYKEIALSQLSAEELA